MVTKLLAKLSEIPIVKEQEQENKMAIVMGVIISRSILFALAILVGGMVTCQFLDPTVMGPHQ